jgi:predicted dehydrogenase
MRVAFVGVGHHHYPLYREPVLASPEHKIVGLSDRNPEVARLEAEEVGCGWSGDFRELVSREKPDFVFVLGRHCDMAEAANFLLDESIPFAVEKPAGLNYPEVKGLADKAAKRRAFAAVSLTMRDSEQAELIAREVAGDEIHYVLFRWFGPTTARYSDPRWQWLLNPQESGGGALIYLGTHHIDWFRVLTGRQPVVVRAALMASLAQHCQVEDYSNITIAVEGAGSLGVLETGYLSAGELRTRPGGVPGLTSRIPVPTSPLDTHYVIRTRRRHITATDSTTTTVVNLETNETRRLQVRGPDHHRFVESVLELAHQGNQPSATLTDMAEVMHVVDDAYRIAARSRNTKGG